MNDSAKRKRTKAARHLRREAARTREPVKRVYVVGREPATYRGAKRNKQFGRRPQGQGNTRPAERGW